MTICGEKHGCGNIMPDVSKEPIFLRTGGGRVVRRCCVSYITGASI